MIYQSVYDSLIAGRCTCQHHGKLILILAWNDAAPKLEIRRWAPNHEKCDRGVTLTTGEARNLLAALKKEVKA